MSKVRQDLTGKTFGHLTVIGLSGKTKAGGSIWRCRCRCGVEKDVRGYHLSGNWTKSCGCVRKETVNSKWPGYEGISNWFWNGYRCGANTRGIGFHLTPKDMWEQALAQNMKCALTGLPLIFARKQADRKSSNASLDRIDSNGEYIKGNIQWVLKDVNTAKMYLSQYNFIDICRLVAKHNAD